MRLKLVLVALVAALVVEAAPAQTLALPIFKSPYRTFKHTELGGYIADPGDPYSIALQGEYRFARPTFDFGLVAAYSDAKGSGDGVFGIGIDGRLPVSKHSEKFPLDASLTGGFGALFSGGNSGFLIPLGVTLGRQVLLENSSVSFTPYVHPVLAPTFGDLLSDVQFGLGLGVDIALTRTYDVRVSAALGDYEGVAVGMAWHR